MNKKSDIMKINNIIIYLSILIISTLFISTIYAENITDHETDSLKLDDTLNDLEIIPVDEEIIKEDCCEDPTEISENTSKTWIVTPDSDNPNQVQKPTVQPVINQAESGDTIILNGTFIHCHFTVNKTLNIIATPGTTLGICPHHNLPADSDNYGIFYITSNANGTVLDGFGFTNDFYHVGYSQYNPFAVLIDGASDIVLKNLIVNWSGINMPGYDKNPQDYIFNPILIQNASNITLENLFLNNTLNGVIISNSNNIRIIDSKIINSNASDILSGENNSYLSVINLNPIFKSLISTKITANNLKLKAGDSSNLKITTNNIEDYQFLVTLINGVSKKIQVKNNTATLSGVKFSKAGTYYIPVTYLGDENHKSTQIIVKISVLKKTTTLTVKKVTLKVKKAKKIKITLKSLGKTVPNKKITFKINDKTFSAKTNSKGIAYVKVKVSKKGTLKYTASFTGDGMYNKITKIGKIKITK